jgi:hypothetical protein
MYEKAISSDKAGSRMVFEDNHRFARRNTGRM